MAAGFPGVAIYVGLLALVGRRLTISLLDPTWKNPVEATLAELERKD